MLKQKYYCPIEDQKIPISDSYANSNLVTLNTKDSDLVMLCGSFSRGQCTQNNRRCRTHKSAQKDLRRAQRNQQEEPTPKIEDYSFPDIFTSLGNV